ncbi:MAG: hypothetical protein KDC85_12150 [Saprospiraceae bacterium]|nr:hypothetical protein [Saprospiraceae bacterium]MCB9326255.1 hypothetical protein [Lewinellaceae bacterium]
MKSKIHFLPLWKSLAALAMLGVYFAFFVLHNLEEILPQPAHPNEICTPELEKDSCHRRVFHNDIIAGCDHKEHLHPPKHKKDLFKAIVSPHYLPEPLVFREDLCINFPDTFFNEDQFKRPASFPCISLRGPPSIV